MPLEPPDEDLPAIQVSLREFVSAAEQMFAPDQLENFLRFVLAGRLQHHDKLARIFINARQGARAPLISEYQLYRDIDSVIGITWDLPFKLPIAIFPLASFRDTLTKDNHLKCPSSCPKNVIGLPLHRIPNMALGKVDRRHITRIFFPGLYGPGQNPAIPLETMTLIYEQCLRPAVTSLNPVDRSRWPITYSAAMTLYRDQKGKFHFGTIDFPPNLLYRLGPKLLEMFQMQDGLQDAFFVHELRGTKGASHHDPCNAEARRAALNTVFHCFDMSLVRPEDWVVDIGLEIQHEGHILQWLTKGHRHLLQFLLPSSAKHKIDSILASPTQYHRDLSAQLEDLGGFRAHPGSRGKDDQVHYINAYTTDKCATYQLHDGIFKRRQAWHLFPASIGKLIKDLERIAEIFCLWGNSPDVGGHEGNARLEIRIPFSLADQVLLQMPDSVIQDTLVTFDCRLFWYFKYYRMAALYHVVKNLQGASRAARLQNQSLQLGALVTYQITALIYRPAEGQVEKILLEASCQHIPADSTNGPSTRPIMYGRGTYFLSDLVNDAGTYHLPNIRPIDSDTLLALYRRDFMEDIEVEFSNSHISSGSRQLRVNHSLRKRKTTHRINDSDGSEASSNEEDSQVEEDIEEVERSGYKAAFEAPSKMPTDSSLSRELSAIQHQFASDIFQLSPSPKLAPNSPWVLLDPGQRMNTKVDIFRSLDLSGIFSQVQYRIISHEDWNDLIFRRYFPMKGALTVKNLQHFPSASYYRQWQTLMDRLDEDDAEIIQNHHLTQWFDKLYWLPHPETDRMWSTRKGGKEWVMLPPGEPRICPRIAINSRFIGKDAAVILVTGTF